MLKVEMLALLAILSKGVFCPDQAVVEACLLAVILCDESVTPSQHIATIPSARGSSAQNENDSAWNKNMRIRKPASSVGPHPFYFRFFECFALNSLYGILLSGWKK